MEGGGQVVRLALSLGCLVKLLELEGGDWLTGRRVGGVRYIGR